MTAALWAVAITLFLNAVVMMLAHVLNAVFARRRVVLEAQLKAQENDRENAWHDRRSRVQTKVQYEAAEINARLELARMTNSEDLMRECLLNFAELKAKYDGVDGVHIGGGPS